jgi:trigger factor
MPTIVREDIDNLNSILKVTLTKEDYASKLEKDIKKYTSNAQIKGFRKGKTPPNLMKKMHGSSFLMDALNDKLQETLYKYIDDEKLDLLGQPLALEDQEKFNVSLDNMVDVTFAFEIGIAPDFELKGMETTDVYEKYAVEVDQNAINKELQNVMDKAGERKNVDTEIVDNDYVKLLGVEQDADNPVENEFSVLVSSCTDPFKKAIIGKKSGDILFFNIFNIETNADEKTAKKYLLNIPEDQEVNPLFSLTIGEIQRVVKSELNQEFFDKAFGPGEVSTEAEAKEKIEFSLMNAYSSQVEALLMREMQTKLMEINPFSLPDSFMKKWLKTQNKDISNDVIESEYNHFAENLRWTIIRNRIMKQADVKITEADLRESYENKLRGYLGGMPMNDQLEGMFRGLTDKVMADEKQREELFQDVMVEKVFEAVRERVTLKDKHVTSAELDTIIANIRLENAKKSGEVVEA